MYLKHCGEQTKRYRLPNSEVVILQVLFVCKHCRQAARNTGYWIEDGTSCCVVLSWYRNHTRCILFIFAGTFLNASVVSQNRKKPTRIGMPLTMRRTCIVLVWSHCVVILILVANEYHKWCYADLGFMNPILNFQVCYEAFWCFEVWSHRNASVSGSGTCCPGKVTDLAMLEHIGWHNFP